MNEKPVERLNYFNGQRLQAADFKLEQNYHMRIRRWLNRSLYTPGIASGLEVYKIEGAPRVKILPGLAIDHLGREVILLEEQDFPVAGHSGGNGACTGPYLTIRYQEGVVAQQDACCVIGGDSAEKPAWGGPARILAEPVLELNADMPHESSGKIALACLTLAKGCASIDAVDTGVRRYIGEGSNAKVRQYALEGVRDIDAKNSARIYFHIRGRQPTAVSFYLKSEKLPTLYYTEIGNHAHKITVNVGSLSVPAHSHGGSTGDAGAHTPNVNSVVANADADVWNGVLEVVTAAATAAAAAGIAGPGTLLAADAFEGVMLGADIAKFIDDAVNPDKGFMNLTVSPHPFRSKPDAQLKDAKLVNMRIALDAVADHAHSIAPNPAQVFPLSGTGSAATAGVNDIDSPNYQGRTDKDPLKFVDSLQIAIDGNDVTEDARTQVINNRPPNEDWRKFGDLNAANHAFVEKGTGPIRIDYLPGVVLSEGEHYIDLSVSGDGNGGRIHFNLYVE